MTDQRLLVGFVVLIGAAVSFGLTIVLFGVVLLAGVLLGLAGLATLILSPDHRGAAIGLLVAGAVTISGPLAYVALAFLQ